MPNVPGLHDMPGPNELRPDPRDCDPSRGPLAYIGAGYQPIHDHGAPPTTSVRGLLGTNIAGSQAVGRTPGSATESPASAGVNEATAKRGKAKNPTATMQPGIPMVR